jgi:hypothetical protein
MVEDAVEAFDSAWLLPPQQGELFDNPKACLRRLQGYTLSQGFAVVITSSKKARAQFAYIHHGAATRNWRGLEEYIKRDTEDNILSSRKREDTAANTKDYTWEMYWLVRSIGKRGSGVLTGQLGITKEAHSHILAPNPFIYKVHQKATAQYQQAVGLALGHRLAHQSYSFMRQVLDSSDLRIDRKTYYNLVRTKPLEEVGFRFACLISNELVDNGSIKGRVLEQLFFISDQQAAYGKRFLPDQVFLVDGTFEINRLGLVLLIIVGVTNTNRNFPVTYNFAKSEVKVSFKFLFDCLKRFIFINNIVEARIVLGDQAAGLIAAMPVSLPNYKL